MKLSVIVHIIANNHHSIKICFSEKLLKYLQSVIFAFLLKACSIMRHHEKMDFQEPSGDRFSYTQISPSRF